MELKLIGQYKIQQIRNGVKIAEQEFKNLITTVGKNHILNDVFASGTSVATWYIGLIDNSPAPTLSPSDTASSHSGWSEFTDYDEATREEYVDDTVSGGSISTASGSEAEFTINASGTLYGIFIISDNTISGTAGVLLSEASLSETLDVIDDDVIKITYTLTLS